MNRVTPRQSGFTLIEIITVIVILSVVSVLGVNFIGATIDSYVATVNRGQLIAKGRAALERMARQLRGAVPNSVRVNGNCVEFLPMAGGGNYIGQLPDTANGASAVTTIDTAPHSLDFGTARYVIVGAMAANEIYAATPVSLASLASRTADQLTLSAAKQWQRNSGSRRFFLGDYPEAFCLNAGSLRYFAGVSSRTPFDSTGIPAGTGDMLADGVAAVTPFTLSAGTQDLNATLSISLTFTEGSEGVELNQEVLIRNVP